MMQNDLTKDVAKIIEDNRERIPAGYELWRRHRKSAFNSPENLLEFLIRLFGEEEKAIKAERDKRYVTDDYENGVRYFAIILIGRLIKERGLGRLKSFADLLRQRHMAYAFYHVLDSQDVDSYYCRIMLKNLNLIPNLYRGLIEFYSMFYGSFKDNEEAIRLLCRYYPKGDDSWLEQEGLIRALLDHIKNAGTPTDTGYAYHGIEQIEKYIHGLPDRLILELLKQYYLFDILNKEEYRHQVFAIINGSGLKKENKRELKFFYLDSLLLADIFNDVWTEFMRISGNRVEIYYNGLDDKMDKERIQVLKNPDAYWDNQGEERRRRAFWVDGQRTARIISSQEGKTVQLFFRQWNEEFQVNYEDWALQELKAKKTRDRIYWMVSGNGMRPEKRQMTFSLLYLDEYRGIKDRVLDFDHRFVFRPDSREVEGREGRKQGLHFYGKSVYSLSCIVGKNGTGKTSIVDFLWDTFYKILVTLEGSGVPCNGGYVQSADLNLDGHSILDNAEARFLVVFRIGTKDYFLTNIADIHSHAAEPYQKGVCHNIDFCKVAYFSQQMWTDRILLSENGGRTERQDVSGVYRALDGLGRCDYSEVNSFVRRKNVLTDSQNLERKTPVNKELCYQFALLRNVSIEKICRYLDVPPGKLFVIYDIQSGKVLDSFSLNEFQKASRTEFEEKYAQRPEAGIGFLSSGQYAKFMFLAKLYWFLKGYHKELGYYIKTTGRQAFSVEDVLQQDETALIFIDEGEIYYHPEWQRRYLSDLLDMLQLCRDKASLQVVFTTNSPFVLSDVLGEDVQYLSGQEGEFGATLGQNIHILLKENFFMDYTIGEYSRKLIEAVIRWLTDGSGEDGRKGEAAMSDYFDDTQDPYEMVRFMIRQIGEPVYRDKLEKMLDERMEADGRVKESRIHALETQIASMQEEVARLKGETL